MDEHTSAALAKVGAANTHEDKLAVVIAAAVLAGTRPLRAQIAALEARLVALEQRPAMQYEGVWRGDLVYHAGAVVTRDGSAWVWTAPRASCGEQPGAGETPWKLFVKRGRDGRDAK